jgi:hypothetical protein
MIFRCDYCQDLILPKFIPAIYRTPKNRLPIILCPNHAKDFYRAGLRDFDKSDVLITAICTMLQRQGYNKMNYNEEYERLAEQFYQDTGIMAPGKDMPAAMGKTISQEERWAAWEKWIKEGKAKI